MEKIYRHIEYSLYEPSHSHNLILSVYCQGCQT